MRQLSLVEGPLDLVEVSLDLVDVSLDLVEVSLGGQVFCTADFASWEALAPGFPSAAKARATHECQDLDAGCLAWMHGRDRVCVGIPRASPPRFFFHKVAYGKAPWPLFIIFKSTLALKETSNPPFIHPSLSTLLSRNCAEFTSACPCSRPFSGPRTPSSHTITDAELSLRTCVTT